MDYFEINNGLDKSGKSPWDVVTYDGGIDPLNCLDGSLSLAAIWKPPLGSLCKVKKRPDFYNFQCHWAVTERVRRLLVPLVQEEVEFLPLKVASLGKLYVIHPLWPVSLDRYAIVERTSVSGNIMFIDKYSITLDPDEYGGPRHMFRIRQARGSAAHDHGCTFSKLIVSETVKQVAEQNGIAGIMFRKVCSAKMHRKRDKTQSSVGFTAPSEQTSNQPHRLAPRKSRKRHHFDPEYSA
ncbi:MAG: hypothetical protein LW816_02335 [Planctomyces sp.]|nr:hypothetical protein [Planctomyces sp.]